MSDDNTTAPGLKRRHSGVEAVSGDVGGERSAEEELEGAWQSVKYYFNRFRYYHFLVADTVDKYLSAACLVIINWYFKLFMGVNEPASVITEED
ncbi:uncharacterized protein LOC106638348 isoform X2 [Copidosoma floridanum]|nr:uncharacterized protein LOC106638348 isoform X2 [Copidosoma floridanum]